ncbi:conserved hypothetical protein [Nitrobacter hamburgensis X14]|uniref:DUF2946 domain-containing protein n=1 Tax=Nitrobacter hamburgensis (strain DSM 10229 / NCIMB 13809 / X14) TaxID=323097 RepID=Q1QPH3_NITHX|nr:conserved hypothetical protein [Nitrobacter hamburgensis X14]
MRRAFSKFLPIVLFALWAQILAPIVPYLLTAAAADPSHSEICSSHPSSDQGDRQAPAPVHDCCYALCPAHAGVGQALLGGLPIHSLNIEREPQRVVWLDRASTLLPHRLHSPVQARAPPAP